MKPHIRYYNFWNKKVVKMEKTGKLIDNAYIRQIKTSYKMNMITKEQEEELLTRIDKATMEWVKRRSNCFPYRLF
jgi:hypothetical protein